MTHPLGTRPCNGVSLSLLFGLLMAVLAGSGACTTAAAQVKRTKNGGIIALRDGAGNPVVGEGNRRKARDKAFAKMELHCGGEDAYEIVEEGEVVVGTNTRGERRQQRLRWPVVLWRQPPNPSGPT